MVLGLVVLLGAAGVAASAIAGPPATHSAPARAAVEMLTVLFAARAAWLLYGRARGGGGGHDLTLAWAVGLFAAVEATAALLPAIVAPLQVDGDLLRTDAGARLLIAAALLAAVAGAACARRAIRNRSELDAWIAGAAVLLGGASLGPVLAPGAIAAGDLLRCAAALALLAGAVRQPGTYLSAAARRAVAQERRRIARDLHDGLSQELAYIAAHAPLVAARSDDPTAGRIAEAAACALDESRIVIASLAQESREPLGPALARAAERIVARAGKVIRVDLQTDVEVEQAVRTDLLRIVMEATTNAVRHSGASEVSLSLTGGDALVLRIADDGLGFQPDGTGPQLYSGFGMSSMQERAERAGGLLRVLSDPGRGTVVEVSIAA